MARRPIYDPGRHGHVEDGHGHSSSENNYGGPKQSLHAYSLSNKDIQVLAHPSAPRDIHAPVTSTERVMTINSVLNPSEPDRSPEMQPLFPSPSPTTSGQAVQPKSEYAVPHPAQQSKSPPRQAAVQPRAQARPNRPKYTEEQTYFIWYWKTDLNQSWDMVKDAFARQFGGGRDTGGLQCRFYRMLDSWGVERVREQNRQIQRGRSYNGRFGVIQRTSVRYPWMREEDRQQPPLEIFRPNCQRAFRDSPCGHCKECHRRR